MRSLRNWLVFASVGAFAASGCAPGTGDSVFATGGADSTGSSSAHGGSGTTGTQMTASSTASGAECMLDDACEAGKICVNGHCVGGCNDAHPCGGTDTCCAGVCADTATDIDHCGNCDNACPPPAHAEVTCESMCVVGACEPNFYDCDGILSNGCESSTACACNPGDNQACYTGPAGTENVGFCKDGTRTCNASGDGYGPCIGQILPEAEVCSDGIDHDCNGTPNDVGDKDGDGYGACSGDCCDDPADCPGQDPKLINPGAFEFVGDGVDNDCDAATSDSSAVTCSANAQKFVGVTALDMAHAMELCQMASGNKWGIVSASQIYANGANPPAADLTKIQNEQDAITNKFGNNVNPKMGATMAMFSSGKARDQNDPNWVTPISGTTYTSSIAYSPNPGGPLGTYLAAHGGNLVPGTCGATTCTTGTGANDSTDLRLVIKVPTNAKSFSYDFRFFSAEYYTFQCTAYNDYYLAMLQSSAMGIPADKNISFDALNHPVSVNNGFFQDCGGNGKGCNTCPGGTAALSGTGFDGVNGGSTEWLTTDAPVVPGETITLDLSVFDVNDHIYDTLVLLDNFRWSAVPKTVGTHL